MHIRVISRKSPALAQDVAPWQIFTTLLQVVSVVVALVGEVNSIVALFEGKSSGS